MFSGRLIIAIFACVSLGLHWGVLQMVGWMTMAVEFSRATTISEALERTFDGQHPCRICRMVQEHGHPSGQEIQGQSKLKQELKLLVSILWQASVFDFCPASESPMWPDVQEDADGLSVRPPLPPPRINQT